MESVLSFTAHSFIEFLLWIWQWVGGEDGKMNISGGFYPNNEKSNLRSLLSSSLNRRES